MGAIVLAIGIVGVSAVMGAIVSFAVIRGCGNSGIAPVNPGAETYASHVG